MSDRHETSTPQAALALGLGGLAPFFACAAAATFDIGVPHEVARQALIAYGASILSFLGGVRWGLEIASGRARWGALSLSVLPALAAWAALLIPPPATHVLLAAAFAAAYAMDARLAPEDGAPRWYPRLRLPLTIGAAVASLAPVFV